MPNPSLPISRVVRVAVVLTPAGAQSQSLSDMLILGTSSVVDTSERYRTYSSLTDVATDFGLTSEEYRCAQKWFAQQPQPTRVLIGRWVNTASKGGLRGGTLSQAARAIANWNVITTGAFKVVKNGGAAVDVTGLNFSGAANLNAVAGLIAASANMSGTTVVWNAFYGRFEFESTTTGTASAIGYLAPPSSGTDISAMLGGTAATGGYLYVGQAAESAVAAVQLMDAILGQKWYGITVPASNNVPADNLAIAAFIEATDTKHTYWLTTQDASVLNSNTTTDIAYQLRQLGYKRTFVQYSSSDANAAVSAAARILTTAYNSANTVITLKFMQEPGVAFEYLNTSQANALEAKGANVFISYTNDTAIIEQGVMSDGTFADIVTGTDWMAVEIQRSLYNLLYTSTTKIPQTDNGQQLLTTTVAAVCEQGVTNGLLAPGVWNSNGFGILKQGDFIPKGYYIWSPSFDTQNPADRAARHAMPIRVAAKLAGAIHDIDVSVAVNQ